MNCDYEDIRSLTDQKPAWFDENAVPRYCEFEPGRIANIYADECALVKIKCQVCATPFKVVFSRSRYDLLDIVRGKDRPMLYELIESKELFYGDPPNIGCCAAGPTMTSDTIRVIEYWSRLNTLREWRRDPRFEIEIDEN